MNIHGTNIWMYVSSYSEEVTGSNTYVKVNWADGREVKFVIDCGLFQECKWEVHNSEKFPYNAEDVDFAIATHFHADHIGRFPYFMNEGFSGKIYTTRESKTMFPKMLNLTAEILLGQYTTKVMEWKKERKARKEKNPKGKKDKIKKSRKIKFSSKCIEHDMPKLIYTKDDVARMQLQVEGVEFEKTFSPAEDISVTFYRNGHMLGASLVVITARYKDEELNVLVTGDYAKKNKVTGVESYVPQEILDKIDMVLCESTYGSSPEVRDVETDYNKHLAALEDTIKHGKTLVYMTNAIERPLVILRELQYIMENEEIGKKLKELPIYFDSTFGNVGLQAYKRIVGEEELNVPKNLVMITSEDRDFVFNSINNDREPTIILLTSPQFYHGSFIAYARMLLERSNAILLFASYINECVSNNLNLPKGTKIHYRGEDMFKNCDMLKVGHFSSHATIAEIGELLDKCINKNTILFMHGTADAKDHMVERFGEKGVTTYSMLRGKTVRLNRFGISKVY